MSKHKRQNRSPESIRPHPVRDQIVAVMMSHQRPISPAELARLLPHTPVTSVSYHVRVLRQAGVLRLKHEGRRRGSIEHFYSLVPAAAARLDDPVRRLLLLCGASTEPDATSGFPQLRSLDASSHRQLAELLNNEIRPAVLTIIGRDGG